MSSKTVCITGCSRGLGRAMIDHFAEDGWTIVGCARSAEIVQQLSDNYTTGGHRFITCDTSDLASVAAFSSEILRNPGPPDLLLNNAAIINRNADLWDVDPEEFSNVIDVNIKGVYHVIRELVPAMLQRGSGVIVNFSSGWGRSTSPEVAPYCASKWAIEGLSEAMSQSMPSGMATIALNPGIINTDMLQSCFGDEASSFPDAEQWAKTAVPFLQNLSASDNGRALTVPS